MSVDWDSYNQEVLQNLDIKTEAEALGLQITGQCGNSWLSCRGF